MLALLLINTNLHFIIHIFGAFAFFATALLHFDSFLSSKKQKSYLVRCLGFFILTAPAIYHGLSLNQPLLDLTAQILLISGSLLIIASLFTEPILSKPAASFIPPSLIAAAAAPVTASLFFSTAFLYYKKSTSGYEKQIRRRLLLLFGHLRTVALFL